MENLLTVTQASCSNCRLILYCYIPVTIFMHLYVRRRRCWPFTAMKMDVLYHKSSETVLLHQWESETQKLVSNRLIRMKGKERNFITYYVWTAV